MIPDLPGSAGRRADSPGRGKTRHQKVKADERSVIRYFERSSKLRSGLRSMKLLWPCADFLHVPLNAVRVGKFHVHFADDYPSSMDVPPLPPKF